MPGEGTRAAWICQRLPPDFSRLYCRVSLAVCANRQGIDRAPTGRRGLETSIEISPSEDTLDTPDTAWEKRRCSRRAPLWVKQVTPDSV